jgi:hypothetical protein
VIHNLKTWPEPFEAVWTGAKTAEFRQDDRGGYAVGDILSLREWSPQARQYSGRYVEVAVTDVRRAGPFGIPEGYALLSFRVLAQGETFDWPSGVNSGSGKIPVK